MIIPPFSLTDEEQRLQSSVDEVHNVPAIRSAIQEFNIKRKIIMPLGESAIRLVGKSLGVEVLSSSDYPKSMYNKKLNILSLSYKQDESMDTQLGRFDDALRSAVVSLKYRVLTK